MGSDSDFPVMKDAVQVLQEFGVPHEVKIVSAHRTPVEMASFARAASRKGIQVIIAGAGGAAHLPGMVAALCRASRDWRSGSDGRTSGAGRPPFDRPDA